MPPDAAKHPISARREIELGGGFLKISFDFEVMALKRSERTLVNDILNALQNYNKRQTEQSETVEQEKEDLLRRFQPKR